MASQMPATIKYCLASNSVDQTIFANPRHILRKDLRMAPHIVRVRVKLASHGRCNNQWIEKGRPHNGLRSENPKETQKF